MRTFIAMRRPAIIILFLIKSLLFGQQVFNIDSIYHSYFIKLKKGDTLESKNQLELMRAASSEKTGKFYFYMAKADYSLFKNEKENAFINCIDAYNLAGELKNDSLLFKANYKTGQMYLDNDDLVNALRYFNRALLLFNSEKNISDRMYLYRDIALVYSYLDKNEQAIEYFLKMEPLIKQLGNKKFLANTYNNLGINYVDLKDYAKALQYYRNSLAIRLEIQDEHGVAQINNNLGSLYYEWRQYDLALDYFLKGSELRKKANVPVSGLIESDINIGKTCYKLNQTKKALHFLEKARVAAININHIELERRADGELITIYKELGNYKKLSELQVRFYLLKDSLYGLNKKEEIGRLSFENKLKQDSLLHA
ncbi:MAG TPA: tetratricopeptide repeat protein, partial [Bacteroidia bacterium]|nr:tetratricopeptide repeat protein [Bacteroidia bacterium]